MNGQARQDHDYRFLTGLALGGVVGAGLALWLAPKAAAEIKARAVDSVKTLGNAASDRYQDARLRVSDAVDGLTRKGQGVRDAMSDSVIRGAQHVEHGAQQVEHGAQEVQRFAAEAKTHKAG